MTFAGAAPLSGFAILAKLAKLERRLKNADLVITAEGAMDRSTLMGKGAGEIARRCGELKIPCIGLAGALTRSPELERLFVHCASLTELTSAERAMAEPLPWLEQLAQAAAEHEAVANLAVSPGKRQVT
jgi:glycerate kinase